MNIRIAIVLSFVAGFVDTATFVGARGVFSAHVTGNFVLFSVAAIRGLKEIDYLKIFLFVPFVMAVGAVARYYTNRQITHQSEKKLLLTSAGLLLVPAFYFLNLTILKDDLWDVSNLFIMMPVLAMGIQNALYRITNPTDPMTTVMTGNVTSMIIEAITKGFTTRFKSFASVILGFTIGCFVAAWSVLHYSLGALIIPALMLIIYALTLKDSSTATR
jgi:uncharacterized membrane protein YoaK (UPF0700 family)